MLEGLAGARLKKEESDRAEKRVREITGWSDPVEEKTGFVEAACQNYEALVEDKRVGKTGPSGTSQRYETRCRVLSRLRVIRAGPRGSWTRKREREREREKVVYISIYNDLYNAARRLLGRA